MLRSRGHGKVDVADEVRDRERARDREAVGLGKQASCEYRYQGGWGRPGLFGAWQGVPAHKMLREWSECLVATELRWRCGT